MYWIETLGLSYSGTESMAGSLKKELLSKPLIELVAEEENEKLTSHFLIEIHRLREMI